MATGQIDFPKTQKLICVVHRAIENIPVEIRNLIIEFIVDVRPMDQLRKIVYISYWCFFDEDGFHVDPGDGCSPIIRLMNDINSPNPTFVYLHIYHITDTGMRSVDHELSLEQFWSILTDDNYDFVDFDSHQRSQIRRFIITRIAFIYATAECARICAARFGQLADSQLTIFCSSLVMSYRSCRPLKALKLESRHDLYTEATQLTMAETASLVNKVLPRDLAQVVLSYFKAKKRDEETIAFAGEFETCVHSDSSYLDYYFSGACEGGHHDLIDALIALGADNWNLGLNGACRRNDRALIDKMITHGATNWNEGLYGACRGGHKHLAEEMIARGASNMNYGLNAACHGGHRELVDLMIAKGANRYHSGFVGACMSGNRELVDLMISKGANDWNDGLSNACKGGHMKLAIFMIGKGADDWNSALKSACGSGNRDLIDLIIAKGATDCNEGMNSAIAEGQMEIVNLMIAKGANNWNDGLYHACWFGQIEMINLMIAKGANSWNTGLLGACYGGDLSVVKNMIERGADNLSDGLTDACLNGYRNVAEYLVQQGAIYCDNDGDHCHPELESYEGDEGDEDNYDNGESNYESDEGDEGDDE